ncbi:thiamine/thiamine pyrophosphate ABC transporter permease ThiP [Haemophilus pittmaniae]|uniref:thiamine/thiamine pyrophosphate ABC transporter permease ThiP n=1 Tax=Haemophilus pittmaniae TaxID=249188 RepID=UPI0028DBF7EC|nr:thiamine/thiamine pyrophosphate ABC transporter permease ThiP [Haemophilus pittmaniae]
MLSLFANPRFRLPEVLLGSVVIIAIFSLYAGALGTLFTVGQEASWHSLWEDAYLHRVIRFSLTQAALSALLSVLLGGLLARILFFLSFPGKAFILRLFSLTFVLPALLAIFGLLGIYGQQGWLTELCQWFGLDWQPRLYGLTGILLAHLFFNIPLAAKVGLQALEAIPSEQRCLAAQLNIRGCNFFRLIEWPYLKTQLLPTFALIFLLCFSSFTIVLALGGGPQYSTLEVAVYQAIFFEFDLPKAALFALVQFVLGAILFSISQFFSPPPESHLSTRYIWKPKAKPAQICLHWMLFLPFLLFIFTPLLHIVWQGIRASNWWNALLNRDLWQALGFSLSLAPTAAILALTLGMAILFTVRRLMWLNQMTAANTLLTAGMVVLAIPTLILAVGLFIWLQDRELANWQLFGLVALCNALAALPFVLRILHPPMWRNLQSYEHLCQSLGLRGYSRWRLVEYPLLKPALKYAFALAATLSLGDFTAIALFGSPDFTSLPALLYRQIGQYRTEDGAITALILLLLCVLLFIFIERNKGGQYD